MRPTRLPFRIPGQRGFVLVTALIFLVMLTLIGVVATKNTTLGLKMSRNFLVKTQTFEAAETARVKVDDVLDSATYWRGWPQSMGGSVTTTDFETGNGFYGNSWPCTTTADNCTLTLLGTDWQTQASSSNVPWTVSDGNSAAECMGNTGTTPAAANGSSCSSNNMGSYPNFSYTYNGTTPVYGYVSIFKLGVANSPGSGAAMISGYEGTGKGAAGSGAMVFYYVRSIAMDGSLSPSPTNAIAYTGADYRAVIR